VTRTELVRALAPLLGPARREALGRLARGEADEIAIRYDEVRDWAALGRVLSQVPYWDGEEWLTLSN